MPDPILVGRNPDKLAALAKSNNVDRWTTDLDAALANKDDLIYFDAGMTNLRAASIKKSHRGKKNTSTAKNPPPLRSRKPSRCFGSPTKQACSATPTLPSPE